MTDIIIIGAGVSGCAIARELSRYKADILVLDKEEDVCCGTSKANSAIVHAGFDARHGSLMARLNVEGSKRMPTLAKELDFAYDQCGSLVVCLSEADRPRLQALYENGVANGVEEPIEGGASDGGRGQLGETRFQWEAWSIKGGVAIGLYGERAWLARERGVACAGKGRGLV